VKGKDLSFIKKISENFLNMIKKKKQITINTLTPDQMTTLTSLSGVQEFPMRVKCATMAWHTCLSAVEKK
jgi:nitrogen fixation NifU-like protein